MTSLEKASCGGSSRRVCAVVSLSSPDDIDAREEAMGSLRTPRPLRSIRVARRGENIARRVEKESGDATSR